MASSIHPLWRFPQTIASNTLNTQRTRLQFLINKEGQDVLGVLTFFVCCSLLSKTQVEIVICILYKRGSFVALTEQFECNFNLNALFSPSVLVVHWCISVVLVLDKAS